MFVLIVAKLQVLAGLVASGLDGLQQGMDLPPERQTKARRGDVRRFLPQWSRLAAGAIDRKCFQRRLLSI